MISCRNLSFYYGKNSVLEDVNIKLPKEGVYALVGENGAGKTTFLKLLLAILKADGITNDYLENCSFSITEKALYDNLTVYENLYYLALLKKISFKKIDEVINKCHLESYKNKRVKKLSKGMKQKTLIAKCLILDSYLYIFDEPYNGLDPKESANFNELIKDLKVKGKLVIISSHILDDLSNICDYVILVKEHNIHLFDKNNISSLSSLFREDI